MPWRTRRAVNFDPTVAEPLTLRLVAQDPTPAVLLGRPCYFGLAAQPPCKAFYWTYGRYAKQVVASLYQARKQLLDRAELPHSTEVVLIGYSGGGALAALLAETMQQASMPPRALVTIAANLDHKAWTTLHGVDPLVGSLNPANYLPLADRVTTMAYAGARDQIAPPKIAFATLASRADESITTRIEDAFDHTCCWEQAWPRILTDIERNLNSSDKRR